MVTPNLLLPALPFHASLDELHLAGSKAPEFLSWLVPRGYKAFPGTNGILKATVTAAFQRHRDKGMVE